MRRTAVLLAAVLMALAGCGDDDSESSEEPSQGSGSTAAETEATRAEKDVPKKDGAPAKSGTTITLAGSEFGPMLFDSRKQAIYIFERDSSGKTVCYDDCAEAWPPVYTEGEPRAGRGVRQSLLGSIERRDGRRQVTYAGKPLYFYAHEKPGEVRCHNVDLNGGLWWVVGPEGKRRP